MEHIERSYKEIFNEVTTFIFDVDGVITDGNIDILSDGSWVRTMNMKDGYAIKYAIDMGYNLCIISGGNNQAVKERLKKLGVTDLFFGFSQKIKAFQEYLDRYNTPREHILYMGDDMPDYPIMERVGMPTCPNDAVSDIKSVSKYISPYKGGKGCVRDVLEQVMKVQEKWKIPTQ